MRVLRSIDGLAEIPGPVVIAAGVFDGMHLGHRMVLETARRESQKLGATAVALTFDPHPATILRPDAVPGLLTPTPFKLRLMERMGFNHALMLTFDKKFAALLAEDFVQRLCAAANPLAGICIGEGWSFGNQRRGNIELLRQLGREKNFFTCEVPPVRIDGMVISSTMIRQAVAEGRLADAAQLLGRDHAISGHVLRGAGLGRQIGFPTANLATDQLQLPPDGVYAVEVLLEDKPWHGVANLGVRPTVDQTRTHLLEIHLFDFQGDLYDREVEVRLKHFLRPEQRFDSIDHLKIQIARDAESAREFLAQQPAAA
ncbi:MAG: bifunctional riboflavin kinase/FAD synthetase [Terrimicrobiaceae bacterium]